MGESFVKERKRKGLEILGGLRKEKEMKKKRKAEGNTNISISKTESIEGAQCLSFLSVKQFL